MLSAREFVAAIVGAARLARFDRSGLRFFDTGPAAFWRSFTAAWIAAPVFALMILTRPGAFDAGFVNLVAIKGIAYVISWFMWPLVMFQVARLLDRERRFLDFIVAYNWAALIQYALFVPVIVLELASGGATAPVSYAVFVYSLVYSGFVARAALDIPVSSAAGIVVLDVVVSLLIEHATDVMLYGG